MIHTQYKLSTPVVIGLTAILACVSAWDRSYAEWLSITLIILAGIPHGAFDLRAAESRFGVSQTRKAIILICYIALGLSMSAFCLAYPGLGLAAFIAISALHFIGGERRYTSTTTALFVGINAILLPIAFHTAHASLYLSFFCSEKVLLILLPCLTALGVFSSCALLVSISNDHLQGRRSEILEHIICLLAWCILPPLSGFCVWFIGRHSLQHFQMAQVAYADRRGSLVSTDSLVLSILAIALLLPLMWWFDLTDIKQLFSASIVLISGLTLPHMVITHLSAKE